MKTPIISFGDPIGRLQSNSATSSLVSIELGVICGPSTLAKIVVDRLEFQHQSKCWGCGELGHVCARCPTNPSRPLSITITTKVESLVLEKGAAWD